MTKALLCAVWLVAAIVVMSCTASSRPPAVAQSSPRISGQPSSAPAPPAQTSSWHWQNPRPQGNNVITVACVSATTCIADGGPALLRTTDGGANWTEVSFPYATTVIALACPSATVCYAAGSVDAARSTDGGQTWTALPIGLADDGLIALSCPTVTTCFAIGSLGTIITTSDSGTTWSSRRNGAAYYSNYGISCPTALLCFLASPNGLSKTLDGGFTWTVVLQHYTSDVACPSATTCFAGGDPTFSTNDGGATWAAQHAPGATTPSMACADDTHCIQTGATGTGDAIVLRTVDGKTWKKAVSVPYPVILLGVGCIPGAAVCLAGGSYGALLISSDSGGSWSELDRTVTRNNFEAISCRTGLFCVAVGYLDGETLLIAITRDGGSRWVLAPMPGHEALTAVSCASTSVCAAVGLNANIATTHDGGATWRVRTIDTGHILNMFIAVSCPTNAVCYAATLGGLVFKSKDGGLSWAVQTNIRMRLHGMDCPTATVCYLASPQTGQSVIAMTVDGGERWTYATLPKITIASLSCIGVDNCVGVGTCRSIYCSGYQAAVTADGGASWTFTDVIDDGLAFVSCGSTTTCVAVGSSGPGTIPGGIQVSNDGGLTWTEQPTIDANLLDGVSCNLDRCWAVGFDGAILAG